MPAKTISYFMGNISLSFGILNALSSAHLQMWRHETSFGFSREMADV